MIEGRLRTSCTVGKLTMGDAAKLQKILADKNRVLYHFTDTRNLPSIRANGLLSMHELRQRRIIVAPGGNEWSLDADKRSGMDRFVHLCFFEEHPMEYVATKEGRIEKSRFLRIDPSVLTIDGVMVSTEVSNKAGALPRPADEMLGTLDLEVIYTRTDWKDPKIQARLRAARKCELLVPDQIAAAFIRNAS
jgi:ssDNA thymidine ADP-ribosyltransferase, DarT